MNKKAQPGQKTVFRRIGGRIVPIHVRTEAGAALGAVAEISRPSNAMHLVKAAAFVGAGFAMSMGAGRLKKLSELSRFAKHSGKLERSAKTLDYVGKFGGGLFAGSEITQLDRKTSKDEKSKILNIGAQGVGPVGLAVGLVGGYATYRFGKRFQKWGYYGGKFPWKLKDL